MRQWIALAGILLVVLLAYTTLPKPSGAAISSDDVRRFVLEDAAKAYASDTSFEIQGITQAGDHWAVDVKIAERPHSTCPILIKRAYTFPPVYFREETLNDRCTAQGLIVYPEEALLASRKLAKVTSLPSDAYGQATKYTAVQVAQMQKCGTSCSTVEALAKQLPEEDLWVVSWSGTGTSFLVAVDSAGQVLANT